MPKKFREMTKDERGDAWSKCDSQGIESYVLEGYALKDFKGTEHETLVKQLAELLGDFDAVMQDLEEDGMGFDDKDIED